MLSERDLRSSRPPICFSFSNSHGFQHSYSRISDTHVMIYNVKSVLYGLVPTNQDPVSWLWHLFPRSLAFVKRGRTSIKDSPAIFLLRRVWEFLTLSFRVTPSIHCIFFMVSHACNFYCLDSCAKSQL